MDISTEAVKAFVEKWDTPARHTDERMTDSPPTPFGVALIMLSTLVADRDEADADAKQWKETANRLQVERDALKASNAKLCKAAEKLCDVVDSEWSHISWAHFGEPSVTMTKAIAEAKDAAK